MADPQNNFKIGDEIIIVENRGADVGLSDNSYYHKGGINKVALKTKGKIIEVLDTNDFYVHLESGYEWHLHSSEIMLLSEYEGKGTGHPDNGDGEKLFIETLLAKKQPFLYKKGKVFLIKEKSVNPKKVLVFEEDKEKREYSVVKASSLEEQVKFYVNNSPEIVERAVGDRFTEVTKFTLFDIAKILFATLGDSKNFTEDAPDDNSLFELYKRIFQTGDITVPEKGKDVIMPKLNIRPDFPLDSEFIYLDNEVQMLNNGEIDYDADNAVNLEKLVDSIRKLKITAPKKIIRENGASKEYELAKKLKGQKIEFDNFGFDLSGHNGYITIYLKIPQYILRENHRQVEDHGRYYIMHPITLGVSINRTDSTPNIHIYKGQCPFGEEGGGLCMGGYTANHFGKMPFEQALVKYLLDARKVVLRGYTEGCRPAQVVRRVAVKSITKEEMTKKGLKASNEEEVDDH